MKKRSQVGLLFPIMAIVIAVSGFPGVTGYAQEQENEVPNPLQPFERLVGGEWHMEGTYSVFEWGLGKLSVHARSYVISDEEEKLVSEGWWFWHPAEKAIRGYFTGIDMGVDLWDYTSEFRGDTLVCDLVTFGEYGGVYHETWTFTSDDEYVWTLYQKSDKGLKEFMSSVYTRKESH